MDRAGVRLLLNGFYSVARREGSLAGIGSLSLAFSVQARAKLLVILPSLLALTSSSHYSPHLFAPRFGTSQLFTFSFAIRNPGREIQPSDRRRWGSYNRG